MKNILIPTFLLVLAACGETGSLNLTQVLGIPAGDKEGTALSGTFSTRVSYVNDGCKDFPSLEVPFKNTTEVGNVVIEQDSGNISFKDIQQQPLFGGVYFDNHYEAGGTFTLDRQGDQNILRAVMLRGRFVDPNTFEGNGEARMVGRIEAKDVDCSYKFTVSGIRS